MGVITGRKKKKTTTGGGGRTSRRPTGCPLLLHKLQPLTEAPEERSLQLRSSPAGHDRSMRRTLNLKHIPRPGNQLVRNRVRGMGQSSMVDTFGFPIIRLIKQMTVS